MQVRAHSTHLHFISAVMYADKCLQLNNTALAI